MDTKIITAIGGEKFATMEELINRTALRAYAPGSATEWPYSELAPKDVLGIPDEQWIKPLSSYTKLVTFETVEPQTHLATGQDPLTGVELVYHETTIAVHVDQISSSRLYPLRVEYGTGTQNSTSANTNSRFGFDLYQGVVNFVVGGTYTTGTATTNNPKPYVAGGTYWLTIRLQSGVEGGDPGKYFAYVNGSLSFAGTWEATSAAHHTLGTSISDTGSVVRVTQGGAGLAHVRNIMSFSGWTSNEDELPKNYRVTEVRANNVTGPVTGVGGSGSPGDNLDDGDDTTYVQMTGSNKTMVLSHSGPIDPDIDTKEVVGIVASANVSRSSIAYTPITAQLTVDGTAVGTPEEQDVASTVPAKELIGPFAYDVPEGSNVLISDIALNINSESY